MNDYFFFSIVKWIERTLATAMPSEWLAGVLQGIVQIKHLNTVCTAPILLELLPVGVVVVIQWSSLGVNISS